MKICYCSRGPCQHSSTSFIRFFLLIFFPGVLPCSSSAACGSRPRDLTQRQRKREKERDKHTQPSISPHLATPLLSLRPGRKRQPEKFSFAISRPKLLFSSSLLSLSSTPPSLFTPLSWRKYQQHGIRGGIPSPKEKIRFWSQGRIEIQIGIDGIEWKEQEILIAPSSSSKQSSEETFACQEFLNPRGGSQTWPPKLQKKKKPNQKEEEEEGKEKEKSPKRIKFLQERLDETREELTLENPKYVRHYKKYSI